MNISEIQNFDQLVAIASREYVWSDGVSIYVRGYGFPDRGKVYIPNELDLELVEHAEGAKQKPLFYLDAKNSQALMDSLWDCGLRPTQGKGSAGAMDATQKHLEDMRKIVSKTLKVEF